MIVIRLMWTAVAIIWVSLEVRLALMSREVEAHPAATKDWSRRLLWPIFLGSITLALVLKNLAPAPIPLPYFPRQGLALVLVAMGLWLRIRAIDTLGRFFTTRVTIRDEHRLVLAGPYRYIRHPAYTGLLLAFAGSGLAMGDYLALLTMVIPAWAILNVRIRYEEAILSAEFGEEYRNYIESVNKLIPWF